MPAFVQALVVVLCLLVMVSDLYAHRVPNAWLLSALLFAAGWMGWNWMHGSDDPPWPALAGLMVGLLVLVPFHVAGWMGAGDVKFFATLGFLLGVRALLPIWVTGSLLGGAHALLIVMSRLVTRHFAGNMVAMAPRISSLWRGVVAARQGRNGLPYAAYLAVGALIYVFAPNTMNW